MQPSGGTGEHALTAFVPSVSELSTLPPHSRVPADKVVQQPSVKGYEILCELGRGGMGVVYKARQLHLNRLVALKMILAGYHAGPEHTARFRAEAEAVARLQHPNTVQIYDVGEQDGLAYFSLEYIEGTSLAQQLQGKPFPFRQSAELIRTLAQTMHYAHQRGIIHRDLKPANVLLTTEGAPKITDFGLAKHLGREKGHTMPGTIMGTPSYMAPEQAGGRSKEIGPAVDIYALGAIFYELLTGRPPFRADTTLDTVLQVISEDPVPPTRLRPKVPRDLEIICLKCLEKEPHRRYASAEELARELGRFLDDEPIHARPISTTARAWRWCRRNWALATTSALAATGLLTALVLAFYFISTQATEAKSSLNILTQHFEQAQRDLVDLGLDGSVNLYEAGAVEKGMLWFAWSLGKSAQLANLQSVLRLDLGECRKQGQILKDMLNADREGAPIRALALTSPGDILVTLEGDAEIRFWNGRNGTRFRQRSPQNGSVLDMALSSTGKLVTAATDNSVVVWNALTAEPVAQPLHEVGKLQSVALSPDGKTIVTGGSGVQFWDGVTGKPFGRRLPHEPGTLAIGPDGRVLATGGADKLARLWSIPAASPIGAPTEHRTAVLYVGFSPNGKRLLTISDDNAAYLWSAAKGEPVGEPLQYGNPIRVVVFSPDGEKVAIAGEGDRAVLWATGTAKLLGVFRH